MILFDFNQTMISSIMTQLGDKDNNELNEDLMRHIVLSNILFYKKKFGKEYGEVVLAADSGNYWRKDIFPYYKALRKEERKKSAYDWNLIFSLMDLVRDEIKENFPYKLLRLPKIEADDIIATLCINIPEPSMIISADKDFIQLQTNPYIRQYSPSARKYITHENPTKYLKEHIIRGDRGDGIPNFLCEDDRIVSGVRQQPVYTKNVVEWIEMDPQDFCDEEQMKNYIRNKKLIDLTLIPKEITKQILDAYHLYESPSKSKIYPYFVKKRLINLMEDLNAF